MMHFTVENLEPPNKIENRILQICYSLQKCACFALLDLVLLVFLRSFSFPLSENRNLNVCVCVCFLLSWRECVCYWIRILVVLCLLRLDPFVFRRRGAAGRIKHDPQPPSFVISPSSKNGSSIQRRRIR